MESILSLIGIVLLWWFGWTIFWAVIGWLKGLLIGGVSKVAPETNFAKRNNPDPFSLKVVKTREKINDNLFDVFSVSLKGAVEVPSDRTDCNMILTMQDVTDEATPKLIICSIDELQEENSAVFQFKSVAQEIPYANTIFTEDVDFFDVPIDFLHFPKKGMRKVKFLLLLADSTHPPQIEYGSITLNRQYVYAVATTTISFENKEHGYEDLKQVRKRIDQLNVALAMYVSGIDGEFHENEGEVIRGWVEKQIHSKILSEEEIKTEKARFNTYIKKAYREVDENLIDIKSYIDELKDIGSVADHYEILESCMQVASADGKAEGKELEFLKDLAFSLNLDMNRIRVMQDKILPISMHMQKSDEESIIGITSEMSLDEIRKHLNSEYKKWNSQTTHSDEYIRAQADEMIKIISKLRMKHLN